MRKHAMVFAILWYIQDNIFNVSVQFIWFFLIYNGVLLLGEQNLNCICFLLLRELTQTVFRVSITCCTAFIYLCRKIQTSNTMWDECYLQPPSNWSGTFCVFQVSIWRSGCFETLESVDSLNMAHNKKGEVSKIG